MRLPMMIRTWRFSSRQDLKKAQIRLRCCTMSTSLHRPREASIALMVDDVDAAVAAALAAGGTSVRAAQTLEEHNFRYAIIADPEGHSIEVMQSGVV